MDETQEAITARIVAQAASATAKAVAEAAQAAALVIAKENSASLTAIAILQTEMTILKNQQTSFESEMNRKMDGLSPKFEKVFEKIDTISKAAAGRPTWAVAYLLIFLFGLSSSLVVYIVTH